MSDRHIMSGTRGAPYAQGHERTMRHEKDSYYYDALDEVHTSEDDTINLLEAELSDLAKRKEQITKQLQDFDALWSSRRKPLENELKVCDEKMEEVEADLEQTRLHMDENYHDPPGPDCLSWVDSSWFGAVCNLVVIVNLIIMIIGPKLEEYSWLFKVLDHAFLVWYCSELAVKIIYHQQNVFIGKVSVVWWNWLDSFIVLTGIIDLWVMPLVMTSGSPRGHASALRMLRLLRLCRLLRFLKLLRTLCTGDLAWSESPQFEMFMSGVIALNAVVMSLELDYPWAWWPWVENTFLIIYVTELMVRMRRQGCKFFTDTSTILWNILDSIIVGGGILDLWLMPMIRLFQSLVSGDAASTKSEGNIGNVTSLLRLMRMLRVLRLVRLLKSIKPLYRLLLGVVESLKAMQWVMVLTLLMLYAGAIFWTSLVGKGLIYDGEPPDSVQDSFGSVPRSLFSLFRLMNGDTDVVDDIVTTVMGQLLFVIFMILSNWAILAILTSVVSDNMISASTRAQEEDDRHRKEEDNKSRKDRLKTLFKEIDQDDSGAITQEEWNLLLQDQGLFHELSEATELPDRDLKELFQYLAVDGKRLRRSRLLRGNTHNSFSFATPEEASFSDISPEGRLKYQDGPLLMYEAFIHHLKDEGNPADKRCVLRLLSRIQSLETHMERRLDEIWGAVRPVVPRSNSQTTLGATPTPGNSVAFSMQHGQRPVNGNFGAAYS